MKERKKLTDFKLVDYGIDGEQYFPGHSSSADWENHAVGIGDSPEEAVNDAIDQLADEWEGLEVVREHARKAYGKSYKDECAHSGCEPSPYEVRVNNGADNPDWEDDCGLHYYIAVNVK